MESTTVVKEFQEEIEEMEEKDVRLKFIKKWKESMLEKKDRDGIRNYPESCIEKMLEDDQVHGI